MTRTPVHVDTKMSRLLGIPPVMVAGMTPTTVPWDFVAATMARRDSLLNLGNGLCHRLRVVVATTSQLDVITGIHSRTPVRWPGRFR
jgi:hypothetical protein